MIRQMSCRRSATRVAYEEKMSEANLAVERRAPNVVHFSQAKYAPSGKRRRLQFSAAALSRIPILQFADPAVAQRFS